MERSITIHTSPEDYTNTYNGEHFAYFQIHIYSVPEIISTYYNPENTNKETVRSTAEVLAKKIKERSGHRAKKITMFEKNGKFLICESPELFDDGEILSFDKQRSLYEYDFDQDLNDIDDYLGDIKVDDFIKNGLITIGASDLYDVIEPIAMTKRAMNDRYLERCEEERRLNLSDPKLNLEIYRIEKNYKPVLIKTFQLHKHDSMYLPEYSSLIQSDERITFLVKDIATGKILEGNLNEDIEGLKYNKWQRKHPSIIDAGDMQRMELDDDDPDFLSWDDYVNNDDEMEEGDEDYEPGF
jgi:hypothetical protein